VKKVTKRILPVLLTFAMLTASSLPALAAPIDRIMSDPAFLAAFDPAHAVTLPYADGEKAAVEIPSNAHYSDYANEGFWFFWDSKQTDSCYAVLSDKFFITNESLTITVKSTNVYKNVTITRPGTYFINRFLLKNEKKGPAGGYQNINWVGFNIAQREIAVPGVPDVIAKADYWIAALMWNDPTSGGAADSYQMVYMTTEEYNAQKAVAPGTWAPDWTAPTMLDTPISDGVSFYKWGCVIPDLQENVSYTFFVRGVNASGA